MVLLAIIDTLSGLCSFGVIGIMVIEAEGRRACEATVSVDIHDLKVGGFVYTIQLFFNQWLIL